MSAIIHFVGIIAFVTTSAISPGPPHMLVPRFPSIIPKENNVIVIPSELVDQAATTWPHTSSGGNDSFEIDVRNISISGSEPLTVDPLITLPHLTCCCTPMGRGLHADYEDPLTEPSSKKASYVFLDHGFLFSYVDPETNEIHVDLLVTASDNRLTITGTEKNKPNLQIVVNLPSGDPSEIIFFNQPKDGAHKGHWHSYYLMGKDPASLACTSTPSDGGSCAPRTDACLTAGARAAKKTAKSFKPPKSAIHTDRKFHLFTDVDCSNSQFP